MTRFNFDEIDRKEWIELGFYYDLNDQLSRWELVGSRSGLGNLVGKLAEYVAKPENAAISEHIHLGSYQYLKIVTWDSPMIIQDGIYGSISDLRSLGEIFEVKLMGTSVGDSFTIDQEYSVNNTALLLVFVREDGFDPSTLDTNVIRSL